MAMCGLSSDRRPWLGIVVLMLVVAALWLGARQRAALEHAGLMHAQPSLVARAA